MYKNISFLTWIVALMSFQGVAQEQKMSSTFYSDSADYKIWKLKINSKFNDFCPAYYKNGILFCSDNENDFGVIHYDKDTRKQLINMYFAEITDSFNLSTPSNFSPKLNSIYHDGPACFSSDQKTIYYTSSGRTSQKKNLMIYTSNFIEGDWTEPIPLSLNNESYSIAHPALSPNGKTLYFVSNMPGGFGGTDIYISKKVNDEWTSPVNLGADINTSGNERFPFVASNGLLYFSSDGRAGMGKLDIYSARRLSGNSYEVVNLGYPINSPANDFGFTCDSANTRGFFSSNRGGTDDNVYGYYSLKPYFCNCDTVKKNNYCFTFYEENALNSTDTAGMAYEWDFGDSTKAKGLEVNHCFRHTGNYSVQLNIIDSRTGVLFFNQSSYEFAVNNIKQLYVDIADSILVNKSISLNASKSLVPGYSIKKYFWNLDGNVSRKGEKTNYVYPRTGKTNIWLGAIAKDSVTKATRNFCSLKIVDVVSEDDFKRIKNKESFTPDKNNHKRETVFSIDPSKDSITYKVHLGSSTKKIPVDSKIFEGLKDVKEVNDNGIYRYTSGEAKKLLGSLPYYRSAQAKGFTDAAVVAFENDKLIGNQTSGLKGTLDSMVISMEKKTPVNAKSPTLHDSLTNKINMSQLSLDTTNLQAYTLFFKSNQYQLTNEVKFFLTDVAEDLVRSPALKVEILSRTDNTGKPNYNLSLSQQRALSIKSYLASQGVLPKRINIIAYGDTAPLTANDTESGKQSNRRADIIIHH